MNGFTYYRRLFIGHYGNYGKILDFVKFSQPVETLQTEKMQGLADSRLLSKLSIILFTPVILISEQEYVKSSSQKNWILRRKTDYQGWKNQPWPEWAMLFYWRTGLSGLQLRAILAEPAWKDFGG